MFAYSRDVEIEWGHCDPAGIVFFPRYFEMFDASTGRLIAQALGAGQGTWTRRYGVIGVPMVDSRARFLKPCRFGDRVVIDSAVAGIGRSSLKIAHRLLNAGELSVETTETRVWAGPGPDGDEGIKARPLPEEVVAALQGGG